MTVLFNGKNVLFYATKHIDLLLKAGADVTVVANDATTVLMNYSLSFSDFKLLIQHGADPSKYAEKLLRWWLADNHSREVDEKDIMLYLIKNYSLDPNTRNEAGRTPLFYHQGFRELGDTMETVDKDGNTPLIYKFTTLEYVFLDNEFSPQYYQRQNNEGKTALHYAVSIVISSKHYHDFNIKSIKNKNPYDTNSEAEAIFSSGFVIYAHPEAEEFKFISIYQNHLFSKADKMVPVKKALESYFIATHNGRQPNNLELSALCQRYYRFIRKSYLSEDMCHDENLIDNREMKTVSVPRSFCIRFLILLPAFILITCFSRLWRNIAHKNPMCELYGEETGKNPRF